VAYELSLRLAGEVGAAGAGAGDAVDAARHVVVEDRGGVEKMKIVPSFHRVLFEMLPPWQTRPEFNQRLHPGDHGEGCLLYFSSRPTVSHGHEPINAPANRANYVA